MNYKIYFYIIFTFISAIGLSGLNINQVMKQNKKLEATILMMTLSFIMGYILTEFVFAFFNK